MLGRITLKKKRKRPVISFADQMLMWFYIFCAGNPSILDSTLEMHIKSTAKYLLGSLLFCVQHDQRNALKGNAELLGDYRFHFYVHSKSRR